MRGVSSHTNASSHICWRKQRRDNVCRQLRSPVWTTNNCARQLSLMSSYVVQQFGTVQQQHSPTCPTTHPHLHPPNHQSPQPSPGC